METRDGSLESSISEPETSSKPATKPKHIFDLLEKCQCGAEACVLNLTDYKNFLLLASIFSRAPKFPALMRFPHRRPACIFSVSLSAFEVPQGGSLKWPTPASFGEALLPCVLEKGSGPV